MEKMTTETVREYNRHQIYRLIYDNGRLSRQEIAQQLRLSLPTVTQNLKVLEEARLIQRCGLFRSTGGRRSVAYGCVNDARVAIGAHITQRELRLVAVDLYGKIIKRWRVGEGHSHAPEYYRRFGQHVDNFVKSMAISPDRVLGVGIALTALLSKDRQRVSKSILLNDPLASISDFACYLDYPCQMFHDSEAAADAELWFSPSISDALYLGLNHHLNGMLIIDGKVHVGKEYTGGLVEHITLYPGGRDCYCGKKGCFTSYCSGRLLYGEGEDACEAFFSRLRGGDRAAGERWESYLQDLSIAIGSLSALLDCDVILGGTVGAYMTEEDRLRLQQLVRKDSHFAPSSDFICIGYKDVDICAAGAAIAYISEFIKSA